MLKILTVCGNGIGSSLMLKMKVEQICEEAGIECDVQSSDFSSAQGQSVDLVITIPELASQFDNKNVATIRSYVNKKKIKEDVLDIIKELANK